MVSTPVRANNLPLVRLSYFQKAKKKGPGAESGAIQLGCRHFLHHHKPKITELRRFTKKNVKKIYFD